LNWVFDAHGQKRSAMRGIPGALVDIVLKSGARDRDGTLEGTEIWKGKINGDEVEVLMWPGETAVVHSVWWLR